MNHFKIALPVAPVSGHLLYYFTKILIFFCNNSLDVNMHYKNKKYIHHKKFKIKLTKNIDHFNFKHRYIHQNEVKFLSEASSPSKIFY